MSLSFASLRLALPFAALAAPALALSVACTTTEAPAAASCDSTQCAPGNSCIAFEGETRCRKTCSSATDPATSCPFGYVCAPNEDGAGFCRKTTLEIERKDAGQWGALCDARKGIESAECDNAQGFYCFAESPTDAAAFCTNYGCEDDLGCPGGYHCATVNVAPNAKNASRTQGKTHKVCLPRTYCSPCTADFECPASASGKAQHCVAGTDGVKFCAPECTADTECNLEARCATAGDKKVCAPRAGQCVGSGKLCDPCRSDADCGDDGLCAKGTNTTEHFCVKKSASSCSADKSDCPAVESNARRTMLGVGCTVENAIGEIPVGYCWGAVALGYNQNREPTPTPGCWTPPSMGNPP